MPKKPGGQSGTKHPLTSFEKAMRKRALYSDPLTVDLGGGNYAEVIWYELGQPDRDTLRMEAIDAVSRRHHGHLIQARAQSKDWTEFAWSLPAGEIENLIDNEHDSRLLFAVMRDAKNPKRRALPMTEIRKISPELQESLANLYNLWTDSISPDRMTPEDIDALWDEVKKKPEDLLDICTRYGYKTALAFVAISAERLAMYEIEKSSDT